MNINRSSLKFLLWGLILLLLIHTFFFALKFVLEEPFDSPLGICPPGFVSLMTTGVFSNSLGTKIVCFPKAKSISTIDECFNAKEETKTDRWSESIWHTNEQDEGEVVRDTSKNAYGVNKSDDCVLSFIKNHHEMTDKQNCEKIADIGYKVKCLDIINSRNNI